MVEPVYVSVFDRYFRPMVSLKSYGIFNNQTFLPEWVLRGSNSERDVPRFVDQNDSGESIPVTTLKRFQRKLLKRRGKGKVCSIKHSDNTYIPQAISQKVDCYCHPSQTSP